MYRYYKENDNFNGQLFGSIQVIKQGQLIKVFMM